jgi:hypothetical protein
MAAVAGRGSSGTAAAAPFFGFFAEPADPLRAPVLAALLPPLFDAFFGSSISTAFFGATARVDRRGLSNEYFGMSSSDSSPSSTCISLSSSSSLFAGERSPDINELISNVLGGIVENST